MLPWNLVINVAMEPGYKKVLGFSVLLSGGLQWAFHPHIWLGHMGKSSCILPTCGLLHFWEESVLCGPMVAPRPITCALYPVWEGRGRDTGDEGIIGCYENRGNGAKGVTEQCDVWLVRKLCLCSEHEGIVELEESSEEICTIPSQPCVLRRLLSWSLHCGGGLIVSPGKAIWRVFPSVLRQCWPSHLACCRSHMRIPGSLLTPSLAPLALPLCVCSPSHSLLSSSFLPS